MYVINARNVHEALPRGLRYLDECGIPMPSRVGDVIVAPGPVTTVYENPCERVLFWPERDANPFLHLFDALWILAGKNDVATLARFSKHMPNYSDDGETFHGAYGFRLRHHFGFDQLEKAVELLAANPRDRRVMLTLWDVNSDLGRSGNDFPCNQQLFLTNAYGRAGERNRLHMMVTCRSHDIIWGLYGANAVQFSLIQEYLAGRLDLEVGNLTQVSWNYHAYRDIYDKTARGDLRPGTPATPSPYETGEVAPYPLMRDPSSWDAELARFFDDPEGNAAGAVSWLNPFFPEVARPMWLAHAAYKAHDRASAVQYTDDIQATDWRKAVREWLLRRQK